MRSVAGDARRRRRTSLTTSGCMGNEPPGDSSVCGAAVSELSLAFSAWLAELSSNSLALTWRTEHHLVEGGDARQRVAALDARVELARNTESLGDIFLGELQALASLSRGRPDRLSELIQPGILMSSAGSISHCPVFPDSAKFNANRFKARGQCCYGTTRRGGPRARPPGKPGG